MSYAMTGLTRYTEHLLEGLRCFSSDTRPGRRKQKLIGRNPYITHETFSNYLITVPLRNFTPGSIRYWFLPR